MQQSFAKKFDIREYPLDSERFLVYHGRFLRQIFPRVNFRKQKSIWSHGLSISNLRPIFATTLWQDSKSDSGCEQRHNLNLFQLCVFGSRIWKLVGQFYNYSSHSNAAQQSSIVWFSRKYSPFSALASRSCLFNHKCLFETFYGFSDSHCGVYIIADKFDNGSTSYLLFWIISYHRKLGIDRKFGVRQGRSTWNRTNKKVGII